MVNGILSLAINILVIFTLAKTRLVDKTLIMIIAFAVLLILNSFGAISSGIRRIYYKLAGESLLTPLQCMVVGVHIWFYNVSETSISMLIVFISVDRLVAMISISFYQRITIKTVSIILGLFVAIACADGDCFFNDILPPIFYSVHKLWFLSSGYVSISIYAVAMMVRYCKHSNSTALRTIEERRERVVTKRLSLILLATFAFVSFPFSIINVVPIRSRSTFLFVDVMWSLTPLTKSFIVVVYTCLYPASKQYLLRTVHMFFACKMKTREDPARNQPPQLNKFCCSNMRVESIVQNNVLLTVTAT
ncbi:unnamed protein product [Soboliphyme baturini]|uniref:G_PROTEIN_RECEP_F1_2 domain-containing protein n=1 Tax=Soboliphyme baturini TaxID=241478 RepID=A0A183IYB9_9BILA|nr:unnamed protein product [Soboliphyme baturini]